MGWLYQLRARLGQIGLLPPTKLALITWYLLGLDIFLFLLQKISAAFSLSWGKSLVGWVTALSLAVIVLFAILALRWAEAKLLWRLRNRLIVTYVFIGVIPVILLGALGMLSLYLFAGQFATFIVTTRIRTELESLQAANSAIIQNLAIRLRAPTSGQNGTLEGLIPPDQTRAGWNVYT